METVAYIFCSDDFFCRSLNFWETSAYNLQVERAFSPPLGTSPPFFVTDDPPPWTIFFTQSSVNHKTLFLRRKKGGMFSSLVAFIDKFTTKHIQIDDVAFNVAAAFLVRGPLPVPGLCALVQSYGAGLRGQCTKVLKGHTAEITALTALPGGKLASGSRDMTARIWVDMLCVRTLTGHKAGVTSLAVLLNGHLASGSLDTTVRFWDTGTGLCLSVMDMHRSPVYALATLLDGRLFSGGVDTFR